MKLRLSVGQIPYSGFTNIDPAPVIEEDKLGQFDVYAGDFKNLETIEDSSCKEIVVEGCLDYIHIDFTVDVIKHWISKLRHGGRIIIRGTNLESVVKLFLNGEITTLDFNHLIYGTGKNTWDNKSGCVNLEEVDEVCRKEGLKILSKQIHSEEFILIAIRP